jgi:hypothetical protein
MTESKQASDNKVLAAAESTHLAGASSSGDAPLENDVKAASKRTAEAIALIDSWRMRLRRRTNISDDEIKALSKEQLTVKERFGSTLLMMLVTEYAIELIRKVLLLHRDKIDIDAQNDDGMTALYLASPLLFGYDEIYAVLKGAGARDDIASNNGGDAK